MKQTYLPGTIRERIKDLMKSKKLTQTELAKKIGISESALSRFISGKTDKLSDESIIQMANIFCVSTDFLLGVVDEPDRKNYDISELGLSAEAAKNLYTGKVNTEVLNRLLTNPHFDETTYLIARYLNDDIAKGIAAQNQLYSSVASLLGNSTKEITVLKTPVYQVDLDFIQNTFMTAVKEIKKDFGKDIEVSKRLKKDMFDKILLELTKGENIRNCHITLNDVAEKIAESVSGLDGITAEKQKQIKKLFITLAGGDVDEKL